jgi:uncharacterized glyoxalase superfamily protein PhnB
MSREASYPTVAPVISYMDGHKALEWLPAAFGCGVSNLYVGDDRTIGHVELRFGDGVVMIAENHGATILSEPVDEGHGKSYRAADLEGHRWMFSQRP